MASLLIVKLGPFPTKISTQWSIWLHRPEADMEFLLPGKPIVTGTAVSRAYGGCCLAIPPARRLGIGHMRIAYQRVKYPAGSIKNQD